MSKTIELAKHLEKLHTNNMYKSDFYWTWDKTDDVTEFRQSLTNNDIK